MSTAQNNCKDCHVCTYARLIEMFMKLTHGGECKCPDKEDLQSTLSGLAYSQLFSQESFDNTSVTENIDTTSDEESHATEVSSIHEVEPYMSEGLSREEQTEVSQQSDMSQQTEDNKSENVFKPYSYNPFEGPEAVPSRNVGWSWNPDVSECTDKWFGPQDDDIESQVFPSRENSDDTVKKVFDPSFNWNIS